MKKLLLILLIVSFISCKSDKTSEEKSNEISIKSYTYETLEPLLNKDDDKTYVINFWATWCKPCVEELPAFEKINANYKDKNVEVILVSLDFPNQIETRLIPFIKEHNLKSNVILMADVDQNKWIPKISEKWSGAIPATLIYNKNSRKFYEQSFSYDLLEKELKEIFKTY
ncbi:MAG: TlpA family protein disulfide reductase [Lutibacter sp.]|uniref:TlpA disulfide reductase family protein n=1 Tax=Lutibacter sp. TaxID=1925666 RepID=UPI0017C9F2AF|nr:TlpA disulfide reductase family protein [Lutibacter sp.]MBT8316035.1 TlpA family protein disulfide reductase [Lutibacter sp.]NNJ56895.1 TlpA family protein disulfide reductase [Lutibacter sp.]